MIPLRDNIPSQTTPIVNYLLIGICSLAFIAELMSEDSGDAIVKRYGMIPARLTNPDAELSHRQRVRVETPRGFEEVIIEQRLPPATFWPWLTMISCMFLHGGFMHFVGNMWFLYVFGDNVEDRLGHIGYLAMYLGTGIAAGLSHYLSDSNSGVPTIGASGAIAGVMGAYAWLYPTARVQALIPLIIIIQVIVVPAPIFLGIWFAMQTYSGIAASAAGQAGGVAWWAHIGGFVAGGLVAIAVGRAHEGRQRVSQQRF